jgi:hypothetical protein
MELCDAEAKADREDQDQGEVGDAHLNCRRADRLGNRDSLGREQSKPHRCRRRSTSGQRVVHGQVCEIDPQQGCRTEVCPNQELFRSGR